MFIALGVWADNSALDLLQEQLQIEGGKVGVQTASLQGALNIGGELYASEGIEVIDEDNVPRPLISATVDGGLCVGECEESVGTSAAPVISVSRSTSSSTQTDENETPTTSSDSVSSTSSSTEDLDSLEEEEEAGELSPGDTSTARVVFHSSGGSGGGSSSEDSEEEEEVDVEDIPEDTASTSSSTDEYLGPYAEYLSLLQTVLSFSPASLGIGMQALAQYPLAVNGWIMATQGIVVGSADSGQQVGFGTTAQGVCLGACDFDIPQLVSTLSHPEEILEIEEEEEGGVQTQDQETETQDSNRETTSSTSEMVASSSRAATTSTSSHREIPEEDETDASTTPETEIGEIATNTSSSISAEDEQTEEQIEESNEQETSTSSEASGVSTSSVSVPEEEQASTTASSTAD